VGTRFVVLLVLGEQGLLLVVSRQGLGHQQPTGREDHALGGGAGRLHVLDVAKTVALEDGDFQPNLPRILDDDGLGRFDGPVDKGLYARGLQLGHHRGEVSGFLVVDLVGHDGDAVLGRKFFQLFLARLAKARVAGHHAILLMPAFFI